MTDIANFFIPTRIVHGPGSLTKVVEIARGCGVTRPLLVSDPTISSTPFFGAIRDDLRGTFGEIAAFTDCGIDARLSQIRDQADYARDLGIDGVVAVGGGSVLCTGKGVAASAERGTSLAALALGQQPPPRRVLPVIAVPTTAGSGAEVSQFTVVKNDVDGGKLVFGGPWAFPAAAILDPEVLSTLPRRPAAIAAVDALTHCIEAIFSRAATPLTDAIAFAALDLLLGSLRGSILEGDPQARFANLLGASMANVACGNTRLCLAHALSVPLEAAFGVEHGLSVGVLMPHVLAFNGPADPARLARVAEAFGVGSTGSVADTNLRLKGVFHALYADLGFPLRFDASRVSENRLEQVALAAGRGLYNEAGREATSLDAPIPSPNLRQATVRDALALYRSCL